MRGDSQPSEQNSPSGSWWPSDFAESFRSISLESKDENLRSKEYKNKETYERSSCKRASQILWTTGMLSDPIPNGFYSVVPVSSNTLCILILLFILLCLK